MYAQPALVTYTIQSKIRDIYLETKTTDEMVNIRTYLFWLTLFFFCRPLFQVQHHRVHPAEDVALDAGGPGPVGGGGNVERNHAAGGNLLSLSGSPTQKLQGRESSSKTHVGAILWKIFGHCL